MLHLQWRSVQQLFIYVYLEISCFVSYFGHFSAKSNNFNCSDENRILGK